jgi:leucine-rich repeat protein SHOC2
VFLSSKTTVNKVTEANQRKMSLAADKPLPACFPQSLTSLTINDHKLTTIPAAVFHLKSLTSLDLTGNLLDTVPADLTTTLLPQLSVLQLAENRLTELPDALCGAVLRCLDVSGNRIVRVSSLIGRMARLTTLNLCNNAIT